MKRKLLFFFCVALPVAINAQVTISAQLPPAGLVQKDQLWDLILVNNKEGILNVNIRMNVQDGSTGELVMSANTGIVVLSKGVKTLNRNEVQPVLYNYNRDGFAKNFLPMGSYVACYQVYAVSDKGEEVLGDECIKLNIDPLSPPLLTSPADKSEVATPYPQFSWVPPAPYDMFTNLNYEIVVAEVLEGQSPVDAIQQNTPVYSNGNISQPYESYTTSFAALQPEKTYAWQVVAKNEGEYAVKTEVWVFKVAGRLPVVNDNNNGYITLSAEQGNNGIYNLKDDNLNIRYTSFDKDFSGLLLLKTTEGETVQEVKQKISYGDNFFNIKITSRLVKEKVYILELSGPNGQKIRGLFTFNNN